MADSPGSDAAAGFTSSRAQHVHIHLPAGEAWPASALAHALGLPRPACSSEPLAMDCDASGSEGGCFDAASAYGHAPCSACGSTYGAAAAKGPGSLALRAPLPLAFSQAPPRVRQRRRWLRRLRALAFLAGAVGLAGGGAAGALHFLRPKLEMLELHRTQSLQEQRQLHAALSQLSSAESELSARLAAVQQEATQLAAALAELQQQQQLRQQQQQQQQQQQLEEEQAQQRQQQQAQPRQGADELPQSAAAASSSSSGGGGGCGGALEAVPGRGTCASPAGDLRVQVDVPGFTSALVSQVKDAGLVDTLSVSLVREVNERGLLPEFAAAVVDRAGSQFANALCFWRWGRRRRDGDGGSSGADGA